MKRRIELRAGEALQMPMMFGYAAACSRNEIEITGAISEFGEIAAKIHTRL
jgi:hypothetical protein